MAENDFMRKAEDIYGKISNKIDDKILVCHKFILILVDKFDKVFYRETEYMEGSVEELKGIILSLEKWCTKADLEHSRNKDWVKINTNDYEFLFPNVTMSYEKIKEKWSEKRIVNIRNIERAFSDKYPDNLKETEGLVFAKDLSEEVDVQPIIPTSLDEFQLAFIQTDNCASCGGPHRSCTQTDCVHELNGRKYQIHIIEHQDNILLRFEVNAYCQDEKGNMLESLNSTFVNEKDTCFYLATTFKDFVCG